MLGTEHCTGDCEGGLGLFHPSRSLSGKMLPKLTYCNYALRDGLMLANTFICYQTTQGQHESADRYFFVEGGRAQRPHSLLRRDWQLIVSRGMVSVVTFFNGGTPCFSK